MTARSRRFTLVAIAFAALTTAAGALAFWPVYESAAFVTMAVVTIACGVALGSLGAIRHWSSLIVTALGLAVFLVLGVALAVPSEALWHVLPSGRGLLDLISATALGWKQLVTIQVPVGSYQALLVPAYLAILLVSVLTPTIALRARPAELAVLPPLALFTTGIVLGPEVIALPLQTTIPIVVLCAFWLVWMRRHRRLGQLISLAGGPARIEYRRERAAAYARSTTSTVAVLAITVAAGAIVAILVPASTDRVVARTNVAVPFDPRDYPSPLTGFRGYFQPDHSDEPMLTVAGAAPKTRISLAALDDYDGVVYGVGTEPGESGSFTRIPDRLPRVKEAGSHVDLTITIDGYQGPWLPNVGRLEQVTFDGHDAASLREGFYYNDTTGTAADLATLRDGDEYDISSVVPREVGISALKTAKPGSAVIPAVHGMPEEVPSVVQRFSGTVRTPGEKLAASLSALAANGYVSHGVGNNVPTSRSGHGADRINELLTADPMLGDQEQYAATAALMARQLGFPARVIVGFVVPSSDSSAPVRTLTGSDISAWIQVQTAKDGWVTVDPNPTIRPVPEKRPQEPKRVSRPQSVVQPPPNDSQHDQNPPPRAHVSDDSNHPLPAWLAILLAVAQVLGWIALGAAVVAAPFLAIIAAKWRRRALRKRAVGARSSIAAGWREFADAAIDHGYDPPGSATRRELAATVGGGRSLALASVADRAVFSVARPTDDDAKQVWRAVDDLRRDLGAHQSRWQRWRAAVSLRSLGGYRGRWLNLTRTAPSGTRRTKAADAEEPTDA